MPQLLELHVTAKLNGKILPNFPYYRRAQVDEAQQFATEQTSGGGYVTLPITSLDVVQALVLLATQQVTVRLNGQSSGGLVLTNGGILIFMDGNVNASASTNVTVDNSSGSTAVLEGLAGGT